MIDEDRTMQLFEYRSDELSPKSNKKVVAVCEWCGRFRVVYKHAYKIYCSECKDLQQYEPDGDIDESERFIIETMIDRIKTVDTFGYDPIKIGNCSNKKVVMICANCGEQRIVNGIKGGDLCMKCAALSRWKLPEPKFVPESERFIENTFIDRIETISRFGYDAADLVDGSNRPVVSMCSRCKKYRVLKKNDYSDMCKVCEKKLPIPGYVPEEDRFINGTGIDRILTIAEFGYDPIDLKCDSYKKIMAVCKECNKPYAIPIFRYKEICKYCALLYKQGYINNAFITEDERFIDDTLIDRIRTRSKFGYDPWLMPINSQRKVIVVCEVCGENRPIRRSTYVSMCAKCKSNTDEVRIANSARLQGIPVNEWTEFVDGNWRRWAGVMLLNEPFEGCHRHHITETIAICIPGLLHDHISHNLKTGKNMGEINMLAVQYVIGEW